MKFMWPSKELLEKHYADLSARPFFPGLVSYMSSGPVVPMVWERLNAVKTGTIRGDLCVQVGRNIIHGSDAVEFANKEIALWFKDEELVSCTPAAEGWVYE
uniref:Nucleoside diphosphate kinase n=1 Tax=Anopheles culicifacies TaxID=139723 RepID=A0A182MJF0_9DIPT